MHVSLLEWIVTLAATIAVLLFDVLVMVVVGPMVTLTRAPVASVT